MACSSGACCCGCCEICRSVRVGCLFGSGRRMGIGRPIDIYLAAGNGEREPLGRLVIGIAPIEHLVHGGRLASVICVKSQIKSMQLQTHAHTRAKVDFFWAICLLCCFVWRSSVFGWGVRLLLLFGTYFALGLGGKTRLRCTVGRHSYLMKKRVCRELKCRLVLGWTAPLSTGMCLPRNKSEGAQGLRPSWLGYVRSQRKLTTLWKAVRAAKQRKARQQFSVGKHTQSCT